MSAITPMLWVMMSTDASNLVARQTQQVEDFGLHGHVEGGGRLVGQNQAGVEHQGHGDDDALLLAAGELGG